MLPAYNHAGDAALDLRCSGQFVIGLENQKEEISSASFPIQPGERIIAKTGIHIALPKEVEDYILQASFDRVNEIYFDGLMDKPSIKWGSHSKSQLGTYEYGTDTIKMSKIFEKAPDELLDAVMHHELLHKKHKFKSSAQRSRHHTKAFRDDERKFENYKEVEKKLNWWASKHKIKSWFWG